MDITLKYKNGNVVIIAISIAIVAALDIICIVEAFNERIYALYPVIVLSALLCAFIYVLIRHYTKWSSKIIISPEGVRQTDEEIIPKNSIDYCYIHIRDFFINEGRHMDLTRTYGINKGMKMLVVVLKDGSTRRINIEDYQKIDAEHFHERVNSMDGMPLFKEPITEHIN